MPDIEDGDWVGKRRQTIPSNVGSHSLWLTAFGETLHCDVISIQEHTGRRGPTTYSSELRCGDRQVHYTPTLSHSARNPGAEMDIVVDKTGFVPNLEPDKVGLGHSLTLLVALLMNAAFIFVVAWLPVREPTPAKPKVDRGSLQVGAHAVTREAAVPRSA